MLFRSVEQLLNTNIKTAHAIHVYITCTAGEQVQESRNLQVHVEMGIGNRKENRNAHVCTCIYEYV